MSKHNLRAIQALAKHISTKDKHRTNLHGVLVMERGNHALYCATDGHKGALYKQEGSFNENFDFVIPDALALSHKLGKKGEALVNISVNENIIAIDCGAHSIFSGLFVNKYFPAAILNIFPDAGYSASMAAYNPEILLSLQKFAKDLNEKLTSIYPRQNGPDAALINFIDGKCIGVIMPIKTKTDESISTFWK